MMAAETDWRVEFVTLWPGQASHLVLAPRMCLVGVMTEIPYGSLVWRCPVNFFRLRVVRNIDDVLTEGPFESYYRKNRARLVEADVHFPFKQGHIVRVEFSDGINGDARHHTSELTDKDITVGLMFEEQP